jgi:hypothetical protein
LSSLASIINGSQAWPRLIHAVVCADDVTPKKQFSKSQEATTWICSLLESIAKLVPVLLMMLFETTHPSNVLPQQVRATMVTSAASTLIRDLRALANG